MSPVRKVELREYLAANGYWQYWLCPVPPDGVPFVVTDSEWGTEGDCPDPVRYIYGWELSRGAES